MVLGSSGAVALLLSLVDAPTAADQIELIKTGLAVGAGAGGAVALVLAGRRQWTTELANRVTERATEDVRHDAAERRITDLYSKAADQLGSEKAAVRMAGVYSLERLAQDTPPLRQTIVNLLCGYLRMPVGEDEVDGKEMEVRRTAQRVFTTHLRAGADRVNPPDTFWSDIELDLRGAVLHTFDLEGAWVRGCSFGGATFLGWSRFDGACFDGDVVFGAVRFEKSVTFRRVRFAGEARFRGAVFAGAVDFSEAVFVGVALFGGTRGPSGPPDGATFAGTASFAGAVFAVAPVFTFVRAQQGVIGVPG